MTDSRALFRIVTRLLVIVSSPAGIAAAQAVPASAPPSSLPSDAEIRKILVDRIDAQHQGVGIVIGVIGPEGRRVISYGSLEKGDARPLNGDTVFEIGSATKVFTSLLLADMVQRSQVALDDPVAKYLPATVKMPERNGRSITLVDLSTHTSGLPRLPGNMNPKDPGNPYADYPWSSSTSSFPVTNSRAISARPMSIQTWAADCWDTCWRAAPEWITKRLWSRAFARRWA